MLIDTHAHINMIIKKSFDTLLTSSEIAKASQIIKEAEKNGVMKLINVGTSVIESKNCILLATTYQNVYASVAIHPNDCTLEWQQDFNDIRHMVRNKEKNKIIAIGECGLDTHYPGYSINRQIDAFKAHIECALANNLPLIIHTRDAAEETLHVLSQYKNEKLTGIIHCFSEQMDFAQSCIDLGFVLGIGGPLTYPKNNYLRTIFASIPLNFIVLETDAPFLPPQNLRGTQNHPKNIATIAQYLADLRGTTLSAIAHQTSTNVKQIFAI